MADIASTLAGWLSTTASNAPSGATTIGTGLDDNLRELQGVVVRGLSHKGADIASATTTDIGAVEGLMHDITGVTTITGLGTVRAGILKVLKFEGILTLTHNATSLILPGGANITTADGDAGIFFSEGSGNWRCVSYIKSGHAPFSSARGTFTASLTGCTAGVTGTGVYSVTNNTVTLYLPALTGTSNTTACTITGLPAAITPATAHNGLTAIVQDNSASTFQGMNVNTDNTITLLTSATSATFTGSGAKGLPSGATITYNLN